MSTNNVITSLRERAERAIKNRERHVCEDDTLTILPEEIIAVLDAIDELRVARSIPPPLPSPLPLFEGMFPKLCASCKKPGDHHITVKAGVRTDLCCECYVTAGNPPADWHPVCMITYARLRAVHVEEGMPGRLKDNL